VKRLLAVGGLAIVGVASAGAASPPPTIFARSATLGATEPAQLFGAVANGREGEEVTIQAKECGSDSFRVVGGTMTRRGGGWSLEYLPSINATVRAVWNGTPSSEIAVRQRAFVQLKKLVARPGYEVIVTAKSPLWRKRVTVQRFDRRIGRWVAVKSVALTDQAVANVFRHFSAKLTLSLPRGTLVRAFLPLAQARPCYLAGASRLLRT
jgi:hypothetical protein